MLISHQYKFIFIKTQKTAGTALEMALRKFMTKQDIITPLHRKDEHKCGKLNIAAPSNFRASWKTYRLRDAFETIRKRRLKRHFYGLMPASELLTELPKETWEGYFKISVERNPYDKAISSYYWHNRRSPNPPSLRQWLQECPESQISNWNIYTINNNIAVDFMIKYEELSNDLIALRNKLNLSEAIELPSEKPKGNVRKDHRPWQEVIDAISMERIRQVCGREIEAFYSECNR